jgi:hypothetical protein
LNVSERSVRTARKVRKNGAPELIAAVDRGEVSVSAVAEVAKQPIETQKVIVLNGDVKKAAKEISVRVEKSPKKYDGTVVHIGNSPHGQRQCTGSMIGLNLRPATSLIRRARLRSQRTCWAGLLDDGELRKLSRMLLGPKKPPVPSFGARRSRAGWANDDGR